MAEPEREQTLADFQACTGLDDVEICITILETHEWNLMRAVQSMMPDDHDGTSAAVTMAPEASLGAQQLDLTGASTLPTRDASLAAGASTSLVFPNTSGYPCSRMLHFSVEYREKNISVVLPDTETVGKIKEVFSQNLSIPVHEMQLCGFKTKKIEDSRVLRDLELPAENKLYILTPNIAVAISTRSTPANENADKTYSFDITYEDTSDYQQFSLSFKGSQTVRDVKVGAHSITDVPVKSQEWTGWPCTVLNDNVRLCNSAIQHPTHQLSFIKAPHRHLTSPPQEIHIDSDSEDEVIESFPDDIFVPDDAESTRLKTLLPPNATDDVTALAHFTQQFYERYGECSLFFYLGSLDNAIAESLLVKARDRKPLAIYLHHDGSILSNVFCSQVLCSESVVSYLSKNFVLWGWDLTHESNKDRWLAIASQHFGSLPSIHLRGLRVDHLPTLVILMRTRGSNEVFTVIPGSSTIDELMTSLIHAVEVFEIQQSTDVADETERDHRESIKQEQDDAYKESLKADRAKTKAIQDEQDQVKFAEEKRQEDQQVQEAIMKSLAMSLPPEPSSNCPHKVSQFRIRTPTGETISRRFLASEPLEMLLTYIKSTGHNTDVYKVLTTFPRRDITELDRTQSLETHKLFPQETLTLEER